VAAVAAWLQASQQVAAVAGVLHVLEGLLAGGMTQHSIPSVSGFHHPLENPPIGCPWEPASTLQIWHVQRGSKSHDHISKTRILHSISSLV